MRKENILIVTLSIFFFFSFKTSYSQTNYINVTNYGIFPNDSMPDSDSINALLGKTCGRTLFFPEGVYNIDKTIELGQNHSILGAIHNRNSGTIWEVTIPDSHKLSEVVRANSRPGLSMKNIQINCSGKSDFGVYLAGVNESETLVENIVVIGSEIAGFRFEKCQAANFNRLLAKDNNGDGFQIVDCHSSFFIGLQAVQNGGNGFSISSQDNSSGFFFNMGRSEKNNGNGVYITGGPNIVIESVVISNFWIEENRMDGIVLLNARAVKVRDSKIIGFDDSIKTSRAIRLCSSEQCIIDGNFISGGDLNTYRIIEILKGSSGNIITGNTLIEGGNTYRPVPIFPEPARDLQRKTY